MVNRHLPVRPMATGDRRRQRTDMPPSARSRCCRHRPLGPATRVWLWRPTNPAGSCVGDRSVVLGPCRALQTAPSSPISTNATKPRPVNHILVAANIRSCRRPRGLLTVWLRSVGRRDDLGMTTQPVLFPVLLAPDTDPLVRAVAAYLARFRDATRVHTESDLRAFLTWCVERRLPPLSAQRVHIELYIRWMQEVRRFKPSTVSRRMSVVAGFYRTCVIDQVLTASPADYVRRSLGGPAHPEGVVLCAQSCSQDLFVRLQDLPVWRHPGSATIDTGYIRGRLGGTACG